MLSCSVTSLKQNFEKNEKLKTNTSSGQNVLPFSAKKMPTTFLDSGLPQSLVPPFVKSFSTAIFNVDSDIQLSVYSFLCFISVCLFVTLIRAMYSNITISMLKIHTLFCFVDIIIRKRSFLTS